MIRAQEISTEDLVDYIDQVVAEWCFCDDNGGFDEEDNPCPRCMWDELVSRMEDGEDEG